MDRRFQLRKRTSKFFIVDYINFKKLSNDFSTFRQEFVDLYIDFVFNKSVEKQYGGFQEGFMKVCGGRVMKLFKPHELMAVVIGNEDYNWDEFETNAEYKNGYSSGDVTVRMFWEVFHELSLEDKKKFLLFLTGSDRIPIQGMKGIKVRNNKIIFMKQLTLKNCYYFLDFHPASQQ